MTGGSDVIAVKASHVQIAAMPGVIVSPLFLAEDGSTE
jgi:hypothetical protein